MYYSILTLFILTLLVFLCNNTLETPLVTTPCTPISPHYPLPAISGGGLEFYAHHITFSASEKFFVPQNDLLHPMCNIGTDSNLLFNKSTRSKLQECLGKVFFLLSFFISIQLLYLSGMNGLAGFTLSGFGTSMPRSCHFTTLSSLIHLQ